MESTWEHVEAWTQERGLVKRNSWKNYKLVCDHQLKGHDPRTMTQKTVNQITTAIRTRTHPDGRPYRENTTLRTLTNLSIILKNAFGRTDLKISLKNLRYRKKKDTVVEEGEHHQIVTAHAESPLRGAGMALVGIVGLRNTEARSLRKEHVHLDVPEPYVEVLRGKRGDKQIRVVEPALSKLRMYERVRGEDPGFFLRTRPGTQVAEQTLRHWVKAAAARAGVAQRVTPHDLRAGVATHLLANGIGLDVVKEQLGHDNHNTTMLYVRGSEKSKRQQLTQAMEAMHKVATPKSISEMRRALIEAAAAGRLSEAGLLAGLEELAHREAFEKRANSDTSGVISYS